MECLSESRQAMVNLFQNHVAAELANDLETTMATMTAAPHLDHVPVLMGGVGHDSEREAGLHVTEVPRPVQRLPAAA